MSTEDKEGEITLDSLAAMIKTGFDDVHTRIDGVETSLTKKIKNVEETLREDVQLGFASMNRRMDDIAEKLTGHEERITKIEHELTP